MRFLCLLLIASVAMFALAAPTPPTPAESSEGLPTDDAILAGLRDFRTAYDYDAGYLEKLLKASPGAYRAFDGGQSMSIYRKALPLDAHYVARVATMQVEDCGPCTQVNLRMAIEAGVERSLLETLLKNPDELPKELRGVRDHARAVVGAEQLDPDRAERLRAAYGDEGLAELAIVITGCRIYPTLKRALLENESCIIGDLEY
ncbi:hypothetical protein Pla108_20440 [Botrimarina colliarenosi]|uniref:Carboxymuconolactone decarboxylase family protein n=1 Tax=Botrimarina colliarenosi TaxID=2528001 RepID=A0A5C6AEN7_9BACT|nr:hypothetical protein [Botrimarina colliarenosi]TWT97890.1 hypothetical protein Pla108_20440 [Botrimarina colliarenosi]